MVTELWGQQPPEEPGLLKAPSAEGVGARDARRAWEEKPAPKHPGRHLIPKPLVQEKTLVLPVVSVFRRASPTGADAHPAYCLPTHPPYHLTRVGEHPPPAWTSPFSFRWASDPRAAGSALTNQHGLTGLLAALP